MNDLELKFEYNKAIIYKNGSEIHHFELSQLDKTRGDNFSEPIMQLLEKTWIEAYLLYDLAFLIDQLYQGNDINWNDTFFIAEKWFYLSAMYDLKGESDTISGMLAERIRIGEYETNEETHEIIQQIVDKRLREYGLTKK